MNQTFPWDQVSELLDTVMELPAGDRVRYLEDACPDEALRQHVAAMILSYEQKTSFLENPPLLSEEAPRNSYFGRRIGPYQLIEEIGEGGMGVVYRALRADDHYLKSVAIKLMKGDFTSELAVMRFRVERQILASLEHPNIARLLDGGATEDGTPYLVMELIEGEPIDVYCNSHRLSTTDRLHLFRQACSAVQYAHQHMVIHRDLKPKNILVTGQGQLKLLDFGIAKILDPESFPQLVEPTSPLMRMLSPEYASPEQVQGAQISTACDIYSLGVVLYELLTGHPPYSLGSGSLTDLTRAICFTEPARPSAVIYREREVAGPDGAARTLSPRDLSAVREGSPARLAHRLEGDLDNILLKALRKEPERRYHTIDQFSDDVRRHLEGLPVMARPDTLTYRCQKFVHRHKGMVGTVLVVLICILGALFLTLREARIAMQQKAQAERRLGDVRDLARSNLVDVHSAMEHLPGSAAARHIAIQRSLKYLDEMNHEVSNDLELTREVSDAYEKIGDIQGAYSGAGIGDSKAAQLSYRKAFELRSKVLTIAGSNLDDVGKQLDVQRKYTRRLMLNGNTEDAEKIAEAALATASEWARKSPGDPRAMAALGTAHFWMSAVSAGVGSSCSSRQIAQALEHDRTHVRIFEDLARANQVGQNAVRRSELLLGLHLSKARQFAESKQVLQHAIAALEAYQGPDKPALGDFYNTLGLTYERSGDQQSAVAEYKKSFPFARSLAQADPQDLDAKLGLQIAQAHLGMQDARSGKKRSGLASVDEAVSTVEGLLNADPGNLFYEALLIVGYSYEAEVLSSLGDQNTAMTKYRRALTSAEAIAKSDAGDMESRLSIAKLHLALGIVHSRDSHFSQAGEEFSAAKSMLDKVLALRPDDPESLFVSAILRKASGSVSACREGVACASIRGLQVPNLIN